MQLDIILEPDLTPAQVAELAVAAEAYGFRTLWHSNYHQNPDAFIALVPAALATSRIKLGVLAVSPWEMPPLRLGNALLTLNEVANGRAIAAIGGGGAVLSAIGPMAADRPDFRMLQGVEEGIEIVKQVVSGEPSRGYDGELFDVTRPYHHTWTTAPTPQVFSCATGPRMLELAGRVADGLQMSDATPECIDANMSYVRKGLEQRRQPAEDFRVGNFWAWHIKQDPQVAMVEARRELVFRAQLFPPHFPIVPYVTPEERDVVIANYPSFLRAYRTRSGVIDGVPDEIIDKLVARLSSTGGLDAIDEQIERFRVFERAGVTEHALRLFDEPMEGLRILAEHVLPHFDRY